jgi:transcription initiation factor IIF auxiliary subunit
MMPKFEENAYVVNDPLNPSESLPQVTEAHFNRGMSIYKGATYALQLTGAGFDLTREKFNVISKRAKAFGAGVKAATEFEKVQSDYYDYQNQLENNTQKSVNLEVNQHRTGVTTAQAPFDKTSLDEKLRQSQIAAQLATAQTKSKQSALDEFVNQLGEVKAA